jgi:hypothetical protein
MTLLVAVVWCIYVTEGFARWRPGAWTIREGLLTRSRIVEQPDLQFLGGRACVVWTALFPWQSAFALEGDEMDVPSAHARLGEIVRATRWLALFATGLFVWIMVVFPVLVLTDRLTPVLLPWLTVALALWCGTFTLFVSGYRRTRGSPPAIETWLTLALSPIALMRAPSAVRYESIRHVHPVAAAAVLCDDVEFLRAARQWHFDRAELRRAIETIADGRKLREALTAPPAERESGVERFCPRCHGTYRPGASRCADCPDVALASLPRLRA